MLTKQHGMTLIGFLFILAAALFVAYIGMKLVPVYINHYSLVGAMQSLAEEPGASNMSEGRIRDLLSRKFDTGYVDHLRARDIEVVRGRGLEIVADYEVRVDLIGNIDAVVSFRHVESL